MMSRDLEALARDRALHWRRRGASPSSSAPRWAADYVTPRGRAPRGDAVGAARARMMWGNRQEATAVLAAINVIHGVDPEAVMLEVGMFPGEALVEPRRPPAAATGEAEARNLELVAELQRMGCRIGASPDGLMVRRAPGGGGHVVEVVEVKNHSPFVSVRGGRRRAEEDRAIVRDRAPPPEIPPWYVPQLQLEMFCVGQHCRSALLVRLTATKGAAVLRLPRDDAYITVMLERALRFHRAFVQRRREPTVDFGNNPFVPHYDSKSDECRVSVAEAVEHTMRVAQSAEVVAVLEHRQVQRAGHAKRFEPLLL